MKQDLDCDVLILGTGFAGLMCADKLTRLGYSVTLLDQSSVALSGTSSRNEGWLHAGTYHSLSVKDRDEAVTIARRCRSGWTEIQQRFPECVELEPGSAVAIIPGDVLDETIGRWDEAQVGYRPLSWAVRGLLQDTTYLARDEIPFAVDDLGINVRMLAARMITDLRRRGTRIILGAQTRLRRSGLAEVETAGGTSHVPHRFMICATGYATAEACERLGLPAPELRMWRSHLITTPRLAPRSVFGVAAGHAAMINHGSWSITGLNEDATLVPAPTFEADLAIVAELKDAVRYRFPKASLEQAGITACVKVDCPSTQLSARSLNTRVVPIADNVAVVLPGKMTESPFVANSVAGLIFEQLGQSEVAYRPVDDQSISLDPERVSAHA